MAAARVNIFDQSVESPIIRLKAATCPSSRATRMRSAEWSFSKAGLRVFAMLAWFPKRGADVYKRQPKDFAESQMWLKRVVQLGDDKIHYLLAQSYAGVNGTPEYHRKSLKLLMQSAQEGNPCLLYTSRCV